MINEKIFFVGVDLCLVTQASVIFFFFFFTLWKWKYLTWVFPLLNYLIFRLHHVELLHSEVYSGTRLYLQSTKSKKNKNISFTRFSSHFEFWISWASVVQPWYNLATNWWGRLLCVNEQWLSSEVTQLSAAIECFFKQWDCRIYSDGINRFFIAWAGILGNKSASPTQTTSLRLIIWLALTFGCHQCWKCHLKSHG